MKEGAWLWVTLWSITGIVTLLVLTKRTDGEVKVKDFLKALLFGGLLGPVCTLLVLAAWVVTSGVLDKKLF